MQSTDASAVAEWLPVTGDYLCSGCETIRRFVDVSAPVAPCHRCRDDAEAQWHLVTQLILREQPVPGWYELVPEEQWLERLNALLDETRGASEHEMTLQLPAPLLADEDAVAVSLVRDYLALDPARPGGVAFTGALFDTWAGGGDAGADLNRFTDQDVNAVAMLSVEIPPRAVIELLLRRQGDLSALLEAIPANLDLHDAAPSMVGEGSAAWRLWDALKDVDGVGWVTAGKLCARKRPRLLPVYDDRVREVVGHPVNYWESLRAALAADNGKLAKRLRRIGDVAGAAHLSILRVFDIITWMHASEITAAGRRPQREAREEFP